MSGYYGVAIQIKDYDELTSIALGNSNQSRTRSIDSKQSKHNFSPYFTISKLIFEQDQGSKAPSAVHYISTYAMSFISWL